MHTEWLKMNFGKIYVKMYKSVQFSPMYIFIILHSFSVIHDGIDLKFFKRLCTFQIKPITLEGKFTEAAEIVQPPLQI